MRVVAVVVFGVDLAFAVTHVIVMALWDAPDEWRVDADGSYAEFYQWAKYVAIIVLLAVDAFRRHRWPLTAWIPLFAYFLVDDTLSLHEVFGYWYLTRPWSIGLGPLGAQSLGELAVSAAALAVLLVPLGLGYRWADEGERAAFRLIAALVAVLLVFGLLVDTAHSMVDVRVLERTLGLVEDLGEMLAVSGIVLACIGLCVAGVGRVSGSAAVSGQRGVAVAEAGRVDGVVRAAQDTDDESRAPR